MKKLIFVFTILFALNSYSTEIIVAREHAGKMSISLGFSDSAFDYKNEYDFSRRAMCFIGSKHEVCELVEKGVAAIQKCYREEGAHDSIKLEDCQAMTGKDEVFVQYALVDDYSDGELRVGREIAQCKSSSL